MSESERNTLEAIHCAAKEEFTEKGFKSASLRNIVKTAGVTTGAFYGYYNSKAELFKALVGETYDHIMNRYKQAHLGVTALPINILSLGIRARATILTIGICAAVLFIRVLIIIIHINSHLPASWAFKSRW